MKITNAEQFFERLLSLAANAERQMTRALPKLARAADNPDLVAAFEHHLEETESQLERLEQAADAVEGLRLKRVKDHAMAALIEDGEEMIESTDKGPLRDAALIGAAQKVEHYEIAAYGTICALADQLGYTKAKEILAETLADEKLTVLAEKDVNQQAA